jgi:hypothetical protein
VATLLDYPAPDYSPAIQEAWGNKVLRDDSGKITQVRGIGRTAPLWTVKLGWSSAGADLAVFRTALRALKGGYSDCYFFTPSYWEQWDDAAAGTGDGLKVVFSFGGRSLQTSPAAVVKVGGVVKTLTTDYVLVANSAPITNLLTANQGDVETDLTGLTADAATLTRDTTEHFHGVACAKLVCTAVSQGMYLTGAARPAAVAGTAYTASAWIKATAGTSVKLYLVFYSAGGVALSTTSVTVAGTGAWQRASVTATAPATTATVDVAPYNATVGANTFYVDCLQVEAAASMSAWIPGGSTTANALSETSIAFVPSAAPTAAAAVTISFTGRRLLLGRLARDPGPWGTPDYQQSTLSVELEGEEV